MKVKIDKNLCTGCGTCQAVCPKVFKINEQEMKAETIDSETEEECATVAAKMCPVQAILID